MSRKIILTTVLGTAIVSMLIFSSYNQVLAIDTSSGYGALNKSNKAQAITDLATSSTTEDSPTLYSVIYSTQPYSLAVYAPGTINLEHQWLLSEIVFDH